jgi:hypothetical protein
MQKLRKAASNAIVTQRATQAINKALVEGKEKEAQAKAKKKKQAQGYKDHKLGRWVSEEEANRRERIKE